MSIGVLGLYLAFAIPIYYRWQAGDSFKQGSWNLGTKWKWMAPLAVAEILITSVYFILPLYPAGAPGFMRGFLGAPGAAEVPFDWKFVNYAPLVLGAIFIALWIGWHVSAKNWFTGPKNTFDLPEGVSSADEIALEHEHHEAGHRALSPSSSDPARRPGGAWPRGHAPPASRPGEVARSRPCAS